MNEEFWIKFYSEKKRGLSAHSTFAQFVYDNYLKDERYSVLDIGCGNGRDTIFFSQHVECIGIDGCMTVIDVNKKNHKDLSIQHEIFYYLDIKNISDFKMPSFMIQKTLCLYARFFLHAITSEEASIFFSYLRSMPQGTKLAFEFRTDKDELYLKSSDRMGDIAKTDHFRRFLNFKTVCKKIESIGYSIEYSLESNGLSILNNEDPVLGRIISQKI